MVLENIPIGKIITFGLNFLIIINNFNQEKDYMMLLFDHNLFHCLTFEIFLDTRSLDIVFYN